MGHVPIRGQVHYLGSDPGPKKPTCSSGTNCPCLNIFRITPHEITEWSFMWNFTIPFNYSYLPYNKENARFCIRTTHENKAAGTFIDQHAMRPMETLSLSP